MCPWIYTVDCHSDRLLEELHRPFYLLSLIFHHEISHYDTVKYHRKITFFRQRNALAVNGNKSGCRDYIRSFRLEFHFSDTDALKRLTLGDIDKSLLSHRIDIRLTCLIVASDVSLDWLDGGNLPFYILVDTESDADGIIQVKIFWHSSDNFRIVCCRVRKYLYLAEVSILPHHHIHHA